MSLNLIWGMYVCICHGVNEQKIRDAVKQGASVEDLKRQLHVGSSCGQCRECVMQMVQESRGATV